MWLVPRSLFVSGDGDSKTSHMAWFSIIFTEFQINQQPAFDQASEYYLSTEASLDFFALVGSHSVRQTSQRRGLMRIWEAWCSPLYAISLVKTSHQTCYDPVQMKCWNASPEAVGQPFAKLEIDSSLLRNSWNYYRIVKVLYKLLYL